MLFMLAAPGQRVVAVPGDHVIVRKGRLRVNRGSPRPLPRVLTFPQQPRKPDGGSEAVPSGAEGRSESGGYSWGPLVVPTGHVVVLGDSRDISFDSHVWGPLPIECVIGRVCARYWPLHRMAWLGREHRPCVAFLSTLRNEFGI